MPRAIWSGSISFGLVSAPVRMYSAIHEDDVRFHLVHEPDLGRIGHQRVCKEEGDRPVPSEEVAKAYEYGPDDLVVMSDEDFRAAEAESHRQIEVLDFVPYEQIDPIYFERSYYLGPEEGAERVYTVLAGAMAGSGLAAVARYVFHDKESLGLLRVREGVITLERMYFADEVRPHEGIAPDPEAAGVGEDELEMARRLIEAYRRDFDPTRYRDTHRERLLEVIERKRQGKRVRAPKARRPEAPPDLLDALRASLSATDGGDGRARQAEGRGETADLAEMTLEELRERAREEGIRGRSKMSKDELREALAA